MRTAGPGDVEYADQIVTIARAAMNELNVRNLKFELDTMVIFDISRAFPLFGKNFKAQVYLAFIHPNQQNLPGAGAFGTYRNIPTVMIRTPTKSNFRDLHPRVFRAFIQKPEMWHTLLHELAHVIRSITVPGQQKSSNFEDKDEYHRSPPEIDAFFMQAISEMWDQYQQLKQQHGDTPDVRASVFGNSPRGMWLKLQTGSLGEIWHGVPEDVRRRWIKRATAFFMKLFPDYEDYDPRRERLRRQILKPTARSVNV